jgi:streptomycin 6-kinase
MNLPPVFYENIIQAFGQAGKQFLTDLPKLLDEAAHRWKLVIGDPYLLSYNYVCSAQRVDGSTAVLKLGVPNPEFTSEINTLHLYSGKGACGLLEADPEAGMMLLECLNPGTMLARLEDDDQATSIAADVLCIVQRPAPEGRGFLSLHGWFDELKGLRSRFGGTTGPFPENTVNTVYGLLSDLFAEDTDQVLLHGDFHHFNILLSERGWLVIDPKGVVGPPGYEVGPFLTNPLGLMPVEEDAIRRTKRRISILAEHTGLQPRLMRDWAICHSLLSAWWDTAADGSGGEYSRVWTEIFLNTNV